VRFVYCYSMKDDPNGVRDVAPKHTAYWQKLGLAEYIGGPFADRSGGLISFDAPAEGVLPLHLERPLSTRGTDQ
jgi:hypothetical protein